MGTPRRRRSRHKVKLIVEAGADLMATIVTAATRRGLDPAAWLVTLGLLEAGNDAQLFGETEPEPAPPCPILKHGLVLEVVRRYPARRGEPKLVLEVVG